MHRPQRQESQRVIGSSTTSQATKREQGLCDHKRRQNSEISVDLTNCTIGSGRSIVPLLAPRPTAARNRVVSRRQAPSVLLQPALLKEGPRCSPFHSCIFAWKCSSTSLFYQIKKQFDWRVENKLVRNPVENQVSPAKPETGTPKRRNQWMLQIQNKMHRCRNLKDCKQRQHATNVYDDCEGSNWWQRRKARGIFIFHWLNADLHFWQVAYPILYDNEERTWM
jgi:hypothetical protein